MPDRFAVLTRLVRQATMLLSLAALLATPSVAAAAEAAPPGSVLLLGPLPLPPQTETDSNALVPELERLPEIDPARELPAAGAAVVLDPGGAAVWTVTATAAGSLELTKPGVYWLAVAARADRWTSLDLQVSGARSLTLYADGDEEASENDPDTPLQASVEIGRGLHSLLLRAEVHGEEGGTLTLECSVQSAATLTWTTDRNNAPASFDESRQIARISAVAMDLTGERIARRLIRLNPHNGERVATVDVIDATGQVLVHGIGDGSAFPVDFSHDGKTLLLRRPGKDGTDVMLWDAGTGELRTVLENEPDLGFVRWVPGGTHLLFGSSRGATARTLDEEQPHRRAAVRERLPDYDTTIHLHLLELESGARRRLTVPGDWILDDAAYMAAQQAVVYGRTVPLTEHPWFATEFRRIDLVAGEDRLITTFAAGWESRPHAFSAPPRGGRVAFIGPPEQVGPGHEPHNGLQTAVYLLQVESGSFTKISGNVPHAFGSRSDRPLAWSASEKQLYTVVSEGSRTGIARLVDTGEPIWKVELFGELGCEFVSRVAFDGNRTSAVFVGEGRHQLPLLKRLDLATGTFLNIEEPNLDLAQRWRIAETHNVPFTGPGGELIDAWWYEPVQAHGGDKIPLLVYYYGGASPTRRYFSLQRQVFAGNGYAVLVINPRGALGYGLSFADHHVNDWGPKASADILAGIDAFLAAHPQIDGNRIGIYGGSYGGFMTAYLLTETDRFAAAVSMYGISNLSSYWGDGAWGYTYSDLATAGSFPWNTPEIYAERSPLFRADKITTPLLLLHGTADTNVPPEESEQLYAALEVLNRPVELILFPEEDHGIAGSRANRIGHPSMMLAWFDKHLRGQNEAWQARWEEKE